MRKFSKFCRKCFAVSMLMLALTYPVLAGDIPYPGVTAPPQTATAEVQYPNGASPIETVSGDVQDAEVTADSLKELAFVVWQNALALF